MQNVDPRLARTISWIAGTVAIVVAIALPFGYFSVSYQYELGMLDAQAEINGRIASQVINANPEMWRFMNQRLEEFLSRRPRSGFAEVRRIVDNDNKIIAQSVDALDSPTITRAAELLDSGVIVGRIEIVRSLRPLLIRTGGAALFGLLLGWTVFVSLKIFPLRALNRALAENARLLGEAERRANEYARLFEETAQLAQKQTALSAIANAASQSLQIHEMLQNALEKTLEVTKRTIGIIRLQDDITGQLRVAAHKGISEAYANVLKSKDRVSRKALEVFATGEIHIVTSRLPGERREDSSEGIQSAVWVPIRGHGQILGVLTVGSRIVQDFEAREIELLEAVGSIFGTAVANARLLEETERRAKEQEALNIIAKATNQSLQRDELLEIALNKVLEVTGRERASIRLADPVTGAVQLVAHRGFSQEEVEDLLRRVPHKASDQVFASGQPLVVNERPQFHDSPSLLPQSHSVAWIPITVGAKVVGVLGVSAGRPIPFMQREVDLLQAVGNVIGVALENARLFQETERRNRELQSLYSVASSVTQSLDIATLTRSVLETIIDVLRVDAGRLYVLDERSQILRLVAYHGIPVDRVSSIERYAPGEGIIGKIFSESKPILVPDISTDPSYKSIARSEMGRQLGFRSAAGLPITAKGRPIGVIYVYDRGPRDFTPGEMGLFSTIGGQIGVALENAGLFEETRGNLRRIQALREIDQAINSTLNLRQVLDVLLEKIEVFLPYASATTVRLFNKQSGKIEPITCRNLDEEEWKAEPWKVGRGSPNIVFESGRPVTVLDIQTDPRTQDPEFFRRYGLISYLGVPLVVQGEVLGVLSLYAKERHTFSEQEIDFLSTLAGQASIAIHEAQLFEETERRRREAEELARVAQFLAENLDMSAVGERIVASVRELLSVRHATLRLLHADGSLHAIASSADVFSESFRGDIVFPGTGVASRAIAEGKTIWSPDSLNDPGIHLTDRMREYQLRTGNSAMMAAPLRVHEKVIGALLLSDQTGRTYSEDEVALLQTFADQAALALENSRLFDEVRQKIVELQQKTSELEKANKAKDEFLSIMSHELRTPLNVVIGYSAMLKEGMLGKVNTEQEDALNKILGRADDQLQMINTILQATQIGAGAVAVTKQVVNLRELLDEIRSSYDLPIHKEITLRWEPASELPIVWTDSDKVKHILQNIIGNAIKFTEKGSITVAVRYIAQPGAIEFKVADTGIGIPPAMLPTIFDKFRQVDSSERREFEGVGLGLYIVKQFTEVLGGKVEVESEEGKGSTFIVTLPAEMPPDKSTRAADMIESGYLI